MLRSLASQGIEKGQSGSILATLKDIPIVSQILILSNHSVEQDNCPGGWVGEYRSDLGLEAPSCWQLTRAECLCPATKCLLSSEVRREQRKVKVQFEARHRRCKIVLPCPHHGSQN